MVKKKQKKFVIPEAITEGCGEDIRKAMIELRDKIRASPGWSIQVKAVFKSKKEVMRYDWEI